MSLFALQGLPLAQGGSNGGVVATYDRASHGGHTYSRCPCHFVPGDWFAKIAEVANSDGDYFDDVLYERAIQTKDLSDQHHQDRSVVAVQERQTIATSFLGGAAAAGATVPDVLVYDARNKMKLGKLTLSSKLNKENMSPDADVRNVNASLSATVEVFREKFGWNSYNNLGSDVKATVHYGKAYDNAEWNGKFMAFGDGDGKVFISFTSDADIGGHELGHAITDFNAPEGLNYYRQSGAINEGYSDVFGKITQQWMVYKDNLRHGEQAARSAALNVGWKVGAKTMKDFSGRDDAIRDMQNPGEGFKDNPYIGDDDQVGHISQYSVMTQDNGGVHLFSGIPNKGYVTATETLGCLTWEQTGQIWFQAQKHLSYNCTFQELADTTLAQTVALYRGDNSVLTAVYTGWRTVGIEPKAKGI